MNTVWRPHHQPQESHTLLPPCSRRDAVQQGSQQSQSLRSVYPTYLEVLMTCPPWTLNSSAFQMQLWYRLPLLLCACVTWACFSTGWLCSSLTGHFSSLVFVATTLSYPLWFPLLALCSSWTMLWFFSVQQLHTYPWSLNQSSSSDFSPDIHNWISTCLLGNAVMVSCIPLDSVKVS